MRLVTTVVSALLFVGCYNPGDSHSAFRGLGEDDSPATPSWSTTTPTGSRGVTSVPGVTQPGSSMSGTLGNVRGFSADGVEVRVDGPNTVQLDAVNPSAQWWVMTRFSFTRPLADPMWAPGSVHTITPGTAQALVSVIACSGPTRGHYTYDGAPSRMVMHVEEGSRPDARLVSFAQYWDNSPHVVTGTFEYLPR